MQDVFEVVSYAIGTFKDRFYTTLLFFLSQYSSRKEGEVYIRSFTFARDVPIRIDYSAKFVDLAHGAIPGILAGLTSLNCSELTLKKVHYRNGISGN